MGLILSLSLLIVAQPPALRGCAISQPHFFYVSAQCAAGIQGQDARSLNTVHGRRLLRQFNEFTAVWRHQQGVIVLKFAANLAKRS